MEANKFRIGDSVRAKVAELLPAGELLVSVEGKLFRVKNHSQQILRLGQSLDLIVKLIHPLRFEISQHAGGSRPHRLKLSI